MCLDDGGGIPPQSRDCQTLISQICRLPEPAQLGLKVGGEQEHRSMVGFIPRLLGKVSGPRGMIESIIEFSKRELQECAGAEGL